MNIIEPGLLPQDPVLEIEIKKVTERFNGLFKLGIFHQPSGTY